MRANWNTVLTAILQSEGWNDGKKGEMNAPEDTGGFTIAGMTVRNYTDHHGLPPVADVHNPPADIIDAMRALTLEDLNTYYFAAKWQPIRGDDLPSGVDLAVADVCVLHGPGKAREFLRRAVGMPTKGKIDDAVLDALAAQPSLPDVVKRIAAYRRAHYDAIIAAKPSQIKWKRGWYNRTARVETQCCELAERAEAAAPVETDLAKADANVAVAVKDEAPEAKPAYQSVTMQAGTVAELGKNGAALSMIKKAGDKAAAAPVNKTWTFVSELLTIEFAGVMLGIIMVGVMMWERYKKPDIRKRQ